MKKEIISLIIGMVLIFSAGCSSKTSNLTANDYYTQLKDAGLTVDNAVAYTAENDPNELLGRPNQYTSKVNFADTTLEQEDENDPIGGSIEAFENSEDVKSRKEYIDGIGESMPAFAEYSYVNGNALLRLSKKLTPEQAEKYETEFMKIK